MVSIYYGILLKSFQDAQLSYTHRQSEATVYTVQATAPIPSHKQGKMEKHRRFS
jgi:hypothetical protein